MSANDCIEWQGQRDRDGYGRFWRDGKDVRANRAALITKLGRPIADGMFACHTCDNPPCVNPDHLYEGSPSDNMRDMVERGRGSQGPTPGVRYRKRDACRRGHPFDETNTVIKSDGYRTCRICWSAAKRRYDQRRRSALSRAG